MWKDWVIKGLWELGGDLRSNLSFLVVNLFPSFFGRVPFILSPLCATTSQCLGRWRRGGGVDRRQVGRGKGVFFSTHLPVPVVR